MEFSKKARLSQHEFLNNTPDKGKTGKPFGYGKEVVSNYNCRGKEGGDIGKENNTYFDTSGGC